MALLRLAGWETTGNAWRESAKPESLPRDCAGFALESADFAAYLDGKRPGFAAIRV